MLLFGGATAVAGFIWLAAAVNMTTAVLGFVTWALYVWIYTPLKTRTSLNTVVGALAGAAPQVVGLVQGIQARRGTLAGLFKKAAALKVKLAKAKKAGRRANLLTKYRATVQAIAAEQQNIAMLEAQAAQQNLPVPPPAPPYALYAVAGVGLVAVIGGLVYLVRRKR